ncbi:TetR family transcriptional regulator [Streptomyces cinnamoneus]|uniref:TetR family transcriptional regulator n=2 Tax=Streptomyces cinnamoneus TaxID=53446 RepID=A0A2G1XHD8_STRCJ|nr:TetR/AcrR family transcriptional regulator [Streptomyces cinnamoneus]PHQ50646.1 TetR family transcriptional regulator [Streptomyces cinnamoneus]PPT14099.1 TetR/AcrR family transcriptional regulator [Streptomyces cinnamoneus]
MAPRSASSSPSWVPAPRRADARRNRVLVMQAARSAFEEAGLAVPLGEIARRAGVGAGTVYRHFPSKEALFRATVVDRVRLFTDTARELATAEQPGVVFFRYLAAVVRLSVRNKGLCDALEGNFEPSPGVEEGFRAALCVLLERAQQAGAVRKDVAIDDVMALLLGCLSMEQRRGPGVAPGRMTALACDSLRPGRRVTKLPQNPRATRNETVCAVCGGPVAAARTGRPARYCGGACRQKAHRERARARAGSEVVLEAEV